MSVLDNNVLTIGLVVLLGVMIFFMFRNGRKRQRDALELQQKMVPGVEIMTSHGIFGRIISIDEEKNEAIIETTPGTQLRVHRQTISKVVEPEGALDGDAVADDEIAHERIDETTPVDGTVDATEPEFGQRVDDADTDSAKGKKAAE